VPAHEVMADEGGASTTPEPATSEAPPARWRFAGGVVAGGLAVSLAVHVVLVGTVLVIGSWGKPPAPIKAVPVDVVTPDDLAKMTEEAKAQPQPSAAETPAQSQQPPQPQPQQPPEAPATPQAPSASPSPEPAVPPPSPPQLDAFTPPLAPSAAPEPSAPPPPPAESSGQAAQLAQLLGLPAPIAGLSGGPPSEVKANLGADEIAGFAAHVQSCWTGSRAPAQATNQASNLTVFIRVRLRRDGSLAGDPEPLGGSASMQALALLKNSLETLKHCPAYTALPADKYDEWRVLDLHFTPSGISTASPVPSHQR
jgi:outer membrane biosynthesis protein TonB